MTLTPAVARDLARSCRRFKDADTTLAMAASMHDQEQVRKAGEEYIRARTAHGENIDRAERELTA